jgi:hypothetical protein
MSWNEISHGRNLHFFRQCSPRNPKSRATRAFRETPSLAGSIAVCIELGVCPYYACRAIE